MSMLLLALYAAVSTVCVCVCDNLTAASTGYWLG